MHLLRPEMEASLEQRLCKHFAQRRPVVLIILDGWGLGDGGSGDAIHLARTTATDGLTEQYPYTQLWTHGPYVGLPTEGDLGGSEVGHITLGAGRIIHQGATRIKQALAEGEFFATDAAKHIFVNCIKHDSALHLLGLLSDGNVHSHIEHFMAFVDEASKRGIRRLYVHALLDGRDVPYQSALKYIQMMEDKLRRVSGENKDYAIASGGGREQITMDRDKIWSRVELGWQTHVHGQAKLRVSCAEEAILVARKQHPKMIDQDLPPFVVVRNGEPLGAMQDGDSVVFMNFRSDRAIEFTTAMLADDFNGFQRGKRPKVVFGGMTTYDEDLNLPPLNMQPPVKVNNPLGDRLRKLGLRQFRLAETQKFPHVTFFFNGGRREAYPDETYTLIPSDKLTSFIQAPKMQAAKIAQAATSLIASGEYQFGLVNFANPDMVGHTGDISAVKQAVQATDNALGQVLQAIEKAGGTAIVTADHGNADEMLVINPRTHQPEPSTKHSLNPVPLWLFDPITKNSQRPYQLRPCPPDNPNTLANIAATIFIMLAEMPPNDLHNHLFILN